MPSSARSSSNHKRADEGIRAPIQSELELAVAQASSPILHHLSLRERGGGRYACRHEYAH